jgi:hypothetical protein
MFHQQFSSSGMKTTDRYPFKAEWLIYCETQTHFYTTAEIRARNNRISVARGIFFVVRIYPMLDNGRVFRAV